MFDLPFRLAAALDGRYTLERELGAGGMARLSRGMPTFSPDGEAIALVDVTGTGRLPVETNRVEHIGREAGGG